MAQTQIIDNRDLSISSAKVLKLALLFEMPLACFFLVYCLCYGSWGVFKIPSIEQFMVAILVSVLLFAFNVLFYFVTYRFKLVNMISFIEGVVEPLAGSLTVQSAFLVSLAAGIGEEFFFRGLLLPVIGLLGSSIAFAITHFFFEIRKYIGLCIVYTLIGCLFGWLYKETNSLWVVVIFHALYDFMALLFFKSRFRFRLRTTD